MVENKLSCWFLRVAVCERVTGRGDVGTDTGVDNGGFAETTLAKTVH